MGRPKDRNNRWLAAGHITQTLRPKPSPSIQSSLPTAPTSDPQMNPTPPPGTGISLGRNKSGSEAINSPKVPQHSDPHPSSPQSLVSVSLDSHHLCWTTEHSQGLLLFSFSNANKHRWKPAQSQHGEHGATETRGAGQGGEGIQTLSSAPAPKESARVKERKRHMEACSVAPEKGKPQQWPEEGWAGTALWKQLCRK